jgi:hypothetical protein
MDLTQEGLPKPPPPPTPATPRTGILGHPRRGGAIVIPECDKPASELVHPASEPGCAAAEYEGKKYYFYNRPYFTAHEATLCPSPWKAPLKADFEALIKAVPYNDLPTYWAIPGRIHNKAIGAQGVELLIFASDDLGYFSYNAQNASIYNVEGNAYWMDHGIQVRCIAK